MGLHDKKSSIIYTETSHFEDTLNFVYIH
jgi:hypothetical protein